MYSSNYPRTGPPTPAEPPYLKFIHDKVKISDTAVTFYKKIAYLLGVIPTITSPVPAIKDGWKIEQSKTDLTRNNLTLLWVFADFIAPTTCANKLLPIIRMVPIQAQQGYLEHQMFALQYYIPVRRTRFQQFGISIREHWDKQPIKIRGIVTSTLHFRTM